MVAFIRQLLVLTLVLLQFAAPLVHAHIGESAPVRGIHLHGLESLSTQKAEVYAQAPLEHISCVQSGIVELGSAVKLQSSSEQLITNYFLYNENLGLVEQPLLKVINFSPHDASDASDPAHSQYPTRAPPG